MKQILIIAYYFPPSGGSGVQRVLKFAKYLPENGWQPTILTVDPAYAAYPDYDESLVEDVPKDIRVVRTRSWDPYSFYAKLQGRRKQDMIGTGFVREPANKGQISRLAMWLRANLFLPDARVGWVPFATPAAGRLIRKERYHALLTSGPPHSVHLVGRRLRRRFGIPWVVDMRDPWTDQWPNMVMPQTGLARRLDAMFERSVLKEADAVVSVSDGVGKGLQTKASIQRYQTITNGFDSADIPPITEMRGDDAPFTLTYVGTLYGPRHVPALVQALANVVRERRFRVQFVGRVDEVVVQAYREAGLGEILQVVPYVPHAEAIGYMRAANVLLVIIDRVAHNRGIAPAKMYEYLALGKPILCIGPTNGDPATILSKTRGGVVIDYDDVDGIQDFLTMHADGVSRGEAPESPDHEAIQAYDRRFLTRRLASLLDRIGRDSHAE